MKGVIAFRKETESIAFFELAQAHGALCFLY
jgi:hypothetical protein